MNRLPKPMRDKEAAEAGLNSDPGWERLRVLLRESNNPPMPDAQQFARMRGQVHQRIALERRAPAGRRFLEQIMLRIQALGSRIALARGIQMAAAAACGALLAVGLLRPGVIGSHFASSPSAEVASADRPAHAPVIGEKQSSELAALDPSRIGSKSAISTAREGSALETTVQPNETAASRKLATERAVASASAMMPATTAADQQIVKSAKQPGSENDILDVAGAVSSAMNPLSPVEKRSEAGSVLTAAVAVPNSDKASGGKSADVMEAILRLKTSLYLNGDDRYWGDVQRVEAAVADVIERTSGTASGDSDNITGAIRLFTKAEKALQEKRYGEAATIYGQVTVRMPDTHWAFLAHYQLANIWFEHYSDFGSALKEYTFCLENYPRHFISDDKLSLIHSRVDLLTKSSENDWEALALYREAQKSGPEVAALRLLDLLDRYPTSPLAGEAARKLADLAARDTAGQQVPIDRVMDSLQRTLQKDPNSIQAASVQFAIADIFDRRLNNVPAAAMLFNRVLEMNPSPELVAQARERVQDIYRQRAITPTP